MDMKKSNRLALLFNSKKDLYNENNEVVAIQPHSNSIVINKENINGVENEIFVQNRTAVQFYTNNTNTSITTTTEGGSGNGGSSTTDYRITVKNIENNPILESFTSRGLNIYVKNNNHLNEDNTLGGELITTISNDYQLMYDILKENNIDIGEIDPTKNYDITISKKPLSGTIGSITEELGYGVVATVSEYYYIKNEPPYIETLVVDNDIGLFYMDSEKKGDNLVNIAGLACKNTHSSSSSSSSSDDKEEDLVELKCQKTSFWFSQLYSVSEQDTAFVDLELVPNGIHPKISIGFNNKSSSSSSSSSSTSSTSSTSSSSTDTHGLCDYYLYLELPKQIFLNKFDNEFSDGSGLPPNLELVQQIGDSDLEKPDYQINSEKTFNLIKLNNWQENNDLSTLRYEFNLHTRYTDPSSPLQDTGKKLDQEYSNFSFDSVLYKHCPLDFENIKNPFTKKNYGSMIDNHFLINDKSYINIETHKTFEFNIPKPSIADYYKIHSYTWGIITLSIFYLFYKIFIKKNQVNK